MKRISGYLIGVTLVIGVLTLVGWWLDLGFLKSFSNNETMNPVTALTLIAAAISFFILYKIKAGKEALVIARLLAMFVLSVGLFKLLRLTGIDVGVNYWLFKKKVIAEDHGTPRLDFVSVFNSAYGFLVTGISLLLTGKKGKWPGIVISYLGLSGFIIGTFVCLGFIYHVDEFYGILPYIAVAPATGLCFVCFSLAILFENNDAGFMAELSSERLGGKIARPLLPIGIGVPLIFGYIRVYLSTRLPFSVSLGAAALTVSIVVVFLIVLWFLARILNKSDAERKQAESQLERQARLFSILPDAVVYGNKDLTITSLNPAAKQMFEVDESSVNLKPDNLFKIEMTTSEREAVQKDLWGEKGAWRGESELTTRSGKKINAMVSLSALINDEGQKTGWLGVYTDISFLRLNEELKAANGYLEQLAFISAHDIKSPILALNGLVELMYQSKNRQPDDVRILDMQKNVIRQMQLTNKALNEILRLRKNLKVRDAGTSETLPLGKIVDRVISTLESAIVENGGKIEMEIEEISSISFPQVYFQSLLLNLLSNAIKYRDPARPLFIKFAGRKISSDTIQFIIEDNGLGFDITQNQHRLYGIFKRFHNHVPGTGIGLHIVKSIVDAFDGTIEVASEPGNGTRFELTFNTDKLC